MAVERTFAIIKPDAVKRNLTADILSRIHAAKFNIVAIKSIRLTKPEAEGFYAVHSARPFFGELTEFMSSGKCVVMVLEAEGAIGKWRDTMGATDPAKAAARHDSQSDSAPAFSSIARTVPTRRKPLRSKSATFSPEWNSSNHDAHTDQQADSNRSRRQQAKNYSGVCGARELKHAGRQRRTHEQSRRLGRARTNARVR